MTLPPFRLQRRPCASARDLPGRNGRETLRFPLPVPARLAVIDVEFHLAGNMKGFASTDIRGLMNYAPEALALPLDSALSLADRRLRGIFELPSLKFAIVVFSSVDPADAGPLAPHHRDLLWNAFGLPVFEQLRGRDGRIVARECEVHDGLHYDAAEMAAEPNRMPAQFAMEILTEHCDCGIATPRLRYRSAARARAAAA